MKAKASSWAGLFVVLLANTAIGLGDASAETTPGEPKLVISESTFDFGTVEQGTKVDHQFRFANQGTGPLIIHGIYPSCGCTAALVDAKEIAPGADGVLTTSFDTTGFQGQKVKTVRLNTNDPRQSSAVFTIQGVVTADIEVNPPRLYFGKVRRGEQKRLVAKISVADPKIAVQRVSSRSDFVTVETPASSSNQSEFTVVLKDNAPIGILRGRVVVTTSSKTMPVLSVPVFARVVGDLTLVPNDVSLGLLEAPLKHAIEQTVELHNDGPNQVAIVSITSDTPELSAEVIPSGDKNVQQIKIHLKEGFEGTLKGELKIVTNHPNAEEQTLILPVYGIVAKKGA